MATTLAPDSRTTTKPLAPSLRPQSLRPAPSPSAPVWDPLVFTLRDTDQLTISSDVLPLVVLDGYVRFQDLHDALRIARATLDPEVSSAQHLASADHALALLAEYLVTRQTVPAEPTAIDTLRTWALSTSVPKAAMMLRAAARYYRLHLVFAADGPDGLLVYLQTGAWPGETASTTLASSTS